MAHVLMHRLDSGVMVFTILPDPGFDGARSMVLYDRRVLHEVEAKTNATAEKNHEALLAQWRAIDPAQLPDLARGCKPLGPHLARAVDYAIRASNEAG